MFAILYCSCNGYTSYNKHIY